MNNKILLTFDMSVTIKQKRLDKHIKQVEVSEHLHIDINLYRRIEQFKIRKVDAIVLKRIFDYYDIPFIDFIPAPTITVSSRLSETVMNDLEKIKAREHLDNTSEAIRYCVEQYLYFDKLADSKKEIIKLIEDTLYITYIKQIRSDQKRIDNLLNILKLNGLSDQEISNLENQGYKKYRSKTI